MVAQADDHGRKRHLGSGYALHACALRPKSRGTVGLNSTNPKDAPRIDPGFLNHPDDLPTLMRGARILEEMLQSQALASWRGARLYPHDGSDAGLAQSIRSHADTIYHPVGTCRMGSDDMA
ncbi:MAG: GMC oxidoreductase, partial [Cyanobium sp.]